MADRAQIADLWGGYGAGNDLRDFDLLESCFTEDMSFTVHIAGGDTVGSFQPRKDVMEFFRAALSPQTDRRRHVLTNFPYLEESANRARPGTTLTEDEVIAHCRGGLASFKVPRYVRFVTEWPMSSTKVQTFRLREQLEAELALRSR